jgi:hypothetical protein
MIFDISFVGVDNITFCVLRFYVIAILMSPKNKPHSVYIVPMIMLNLQKIAFFFLFSLMALNTLGAENIKEAKAFFNNLSPNDFSGTAVYSYELQYFPDPSVSVEEADTMVEADIARAGGRPTEESNPHLRKQLQALRHGGKMDSIRLNVVASKGGILRTDIVVPWQSNIQISFFSNGRWQDVVSAPAIYFQPDGLSGKIVAERLLLGQETSMPGLRVWASGLPPFDRYERFNTVSVSKSEIDSKSVNWVFRDGRFRLSCMAEKSVYSQSWNINLYEDIMIDFDSTDNTYPGFTYKFQDYKLFESIELPRIILYEARRPAKNSPQTTFVYVSAVLTLLEANVDNLQEVLSPFDDLKSVAVADYTVNLEKPVSYDYTSGLSYTDQEKLAVAGYVDQYGSDE